jgi:hypothetical protein
VDGSVKHFVEMKMVIHRSFMNVPDPFVSLIKSHMDMARTMVLPFGCHGILMTQKIYQNSKMTPFTYNFFVIITNIKYVLGENIQIKIKKGKKDILYFGCILRYILIPMGFGIS